jgi:pyruvate dehydrogenase E2 component (dihydrolipoamide acetyltransferase)
MGYVVRMPQLGMSMEEGTVVEWRVETGERVEEDDVIAVVESEKTTADVEAREAGVLRRILVEAGVTVEPGDAIGVVAGPDEDLDPSLADVDEPEAADPVSSGETDAPATGSQSTGDAGGGAAGGSSDDVRATPGARQRAEEAGVDLTTVEGTGPQGVVTEEDVESTAASGTAQSTVAMRTVTEARPLSGMQRTISERLAASDDNAVRVTLDRTFDASVLRETVRAARDAGADVSLIDALLAAVTEALADHPAFNATFEDGEHRLVEEVNLGVAVDVEDGLVTPVIGDAGSLRVEALSARRGELVERVRAGEFTGDDLAGGTFTVSNLGAFGVDHFDPVIDPPQVAILGVGRVRDDDSMTLSLSFDHRVVNGADGARFLDSLVDAATDPDALAARFEADIETGSGRESETRAVTVENGSGLSGTYAVDGLDDAVAFDEPTDAGGGGTAPTPVEHLLGALGSCLSLSVRAMADRHDVALGAVEADVDGTPDQGPLESVAVTLTIESDAEAEALDRVVTTAERACYVERTLAADLDVSVEWRRGGG